MKLHDLATWDIAGLVASLAAVTSTGLLPALVEGGSFEGVDPEALALVMDVLVCAGLVERAGERYALRADLSESLRSGPGGLDGMVTLWSHTERFLKTGERVARMDGAGAERGAAYAGAVGGLGNLFTDAAVVLARRAGLAPKTVLDVGAGSGVWSLALAGRETTVTALDLEPVLPRFLARAHALGHTHTRTLAGDFNRIVIDERFDVVVLAMVLHLEPADGARRLLMRMAERVAPGGALVIVDVLGSDEPQRAFASAIYRLHLSMRTARGRAHPDAEIRAWLAEAGFAAVEHIDLHEQAHGAAALVARR